MREDVGWREGSAGKEGVVEGDSCGYCAVDSKRRAWIQPVNRARSVDRDN